MHKLLRYGLPGCGKDGEREAGKNGNSLRERAAGAWKERVLTVLEVALLAGMVLFSFYLLYCSVQEGEQAVNGTASDSENGKHMDSDEKETMRSVADESETGKTDEELENELNDVNELNNLNDLNDESDKALVYCLEDEIPQIRVRILNSDYTDDCFEKIQIMSAEGFSVEYGTFGDDYVFMKSSGEEVPGEVCTVILSDLAVGEALRFSSNTDGTLTVKNLERSGGEPAYAGELLVYRLAEGLALVNVLELETYLYGVLPSEMPSWYPAEAQKAQAVCARTYAWLCMEKNKTADSIADLDDSVAFQVYNNQKSTDASRAAVDATCGEILSVEEVLYYSTSCLSEGRGELSEEAAFREFLAKEPEDGAEYGSAWLRWQVDLPVSQILQELQTDYEIRADTLEAIAVETRAGNGQAVLLRIQAGGEILEIEGEYAIRKFLSPQETAVVLMDGSMVSGMQLLPSAFFSIEYVEKTEKNVGGALDQDDSDDTDQTDRETETETGTGVVAGQEVLHIWGGGYGHGKGMSQCGAAQMASEGASYLEILSSYF